MKEVRFGIIGPGTISSRFAKVLGTVEGVGLTAVASSSSPQKAEAFARKFGAERAYGDYLRLAEDPEPEGFTHEVRHFADLYRNGKKESNLVPLSDTVACAEIFDRLRAQWKLK